MRYLRAFFKALQMTAKGESIVPSHFQPLEVWIHDGLEKLDAVLMSAEQNGLNEAKRESIQLKIDGRMLSMERVLLMIQHNFCTEYPKLMQFNDPFTMTVVQSSNFNDQYRVSRLLEIDELANPSIHAPLAELNEHLFSLPQITIETELK